MNLGRMKEPGRAALYGRLANRGAEKLARRAWHLVCRMIGHRRSTASMHSVGGSWYSWCERCKAKLVRARAGFWRELTPEELGSQLYVAARREEANAPLALAATPEKAETKRKRSPRGSGTSRPRQRRA